MKLSLMLIASACLLFATACSTNHKVSDAGPVIIHIVGHDDVITVRGSSRGPLYSVEDLEGRVFLTSRTLQAWLTTDGVDLSTIGFFSLIGFAPWNDSTPQYGTRFSMFQ